MMVKSEVNDNLKKTKRNCKSTMGLEQGSSGIGAFKDQEEKSN